jgi:SpoU rRNA Methylase family
MYMVLTNISKRSNIRSLLLAAAAFECKRILVVGQRNFNFELSSSLLSSENSTLTKTASTTIAATKNDANTNDTNDDTNDISDRTITRENNQQHEQSKQKSDLPKAIEHLVANGTLPIQRFQKWDECYRYLSSHRIKLIGVEIHPESKLMNEILQDLESTIGPNGYGRDDPWNDNRNVDRNNCRDSLNGNDESGGTTPSCADGVAFIFGNEGTGLNTKHMDACSNQFVRIPQYGKGTASLNVATAASIVMYQYFTWRRRLLEQ